MLILLMHILIILASAPLYLKKIPMNALYGIRIPVAMVSEHNWYLVNSYGGKLMMIWGLVGFLIALGLTYRNGEWVRLKYAWVTALIYLVPLIQLLFFLPKDVV